MAAYTAGYMTHVTCRLTAKNRDQLRNPIRSIIEYMLPLPFLSIGTRDLSHDCLETDALCRSQSGHLLALSYLSLDTSKSIVVIQSHE